MTSKAGERLGIPLLGTLQTGAPADLIAVKGNPFERFKILEYPDLVIAGGANSSQPDQKPQPPMKF